ncbi:MAG: ferredoxin reductase [Deltaproteobacteria bacterium]|nr:ferredoxin reductase [Deltaproteobacteria bacterium]
MAWIQEVSRAWTKTRRTAAQRLFLDRQAEFWLAEVDPVRSLTETRARVVRIVEETADTKTFVLRPSANWPGHRPGQFTTVEVEIDGVRVRRCYSISSAPGDSLVAFTVKRLPTGRVSTWLHDHLSPGDVLRLSEPAGDFVLPEPAPEKLLFVSGGSGITPVMSMLRALDQGDAVRDLVFVNYARSRSDVIFAAELQSLAARHPGLGLVLRLDDDPSPRRGFDEADFAELVPDFLDRSTFLCGPAPLMDRAEKMWRARGASARLSRERFSAEPQLRALSGPTSEVLVRFGRSGRDLVATGAGTLLEQLERAGERPPSGCRMGICHTCTCRKKSGTVENLVTGEVSSEPDQKIRLCISAPRSDLELDL